MASAEKIQADFDRLDKAGLTDWPQAICRFGVSHR